MVEEEEEEMSMRELIPGDVCALEILPRLSAKHLLTLKAVCKDWLKLFRSPYFVRRHLSSTPNYQTRIRVLKPLMHKGIQVNKHQINGIDFGIDDYDSYYSNSNSRRIVPYPPGISDWETIIIGSVDGLICLLEISLESGVRWRRFKMAIYNPSTRRVFSVQIRTFVNISRCWFGTCSVVGEYILVMLQQTCGPRYEFGVYKLTRSFTNLICIQSIFVDLDTPNTSICYPNFVDYRGVLVRGAVHWRITRCNRDIANGHDYRTLSYAIIAYHLQSNSHLEFLPPAQYPDFRLGVADGCLCATLKNERDRVFELWIRKEESCWTKYANIHGFNNYGDLFPLEFFHNTGDLLLDTGSKLIKYNINNNHAMLLKDYGHAATFGYNAIMCADSLVSPSICRSVE